MRKLNKKKIIFTYEFGLSSDGYGGGQSILLGLLNQYLKNNYEVYLVTPKTIKINKNFNNLKCKIIYSKKYNNQLLTSLALVKSFFFLLKKISDQSNYNLKVLSFTSEAFLCSLISKFKNIKFYTYLAAPQIPKLRSYLNIANIKKNILLILFFFGAKFSKKCFCISNFILNDLKKNYNFKNLINVNCGISKKFLSSQFQNEKKKKINLFYVGRLALKQKPLDLIIKSLANIRSFNKFFIAGSGPDKKNLLKLIKIKKLEKKVIFLGNLNEDLIINYSKKCEITILISNYESFMITAYEMAAIIKKLILSDVADLKKKLSKFKGIIFVKNNVQDIAKAINKVKKIKVKNYDLEIRKNYLNNNFTWSKVFNEIEKY